MLAIKSIYGITIIGEAPSKINGGRSRKMVRARCHCGRVFNADLSKLKLGMLKSCGCLNGRVHQLVKKTPAAIYPYKHESDDFNSWVAVIQEKGCMALVVSLWGEDKDLALRVLVEYRERECKHEPL